MSVIIPAFGDPAPVVAAVHRLLAIPADLHVEVIVVDNDPQRGLPALLPRSPRLHLVEPGYNTGFTGAINRGIEVSRGKFVLFHNADARIDHDYVATLVAFMRAHPNAGAASGKTVREGTPGERVIDSAGIVMRRDRSAYDRGEGAPDDGRFAEAEEVFAVSGAALLARRAALDDVAVDGEYLPESFFMYKEDIDLCWRLRLRGWECWYVPTAVAEHDRGGRGVGGAGYLRGLRRYCQNERKKAPHNRVHSTKNEILMMVRNEGGLSLRDLPRILLRQAALHVVTLLFAPRAEVRSLVLLAGALPSARRERRVIQQRAVVDPGSVPRRWFQP